MVRAGPEGPPALLFVVHFSAHMKDVLKGVLYVTLFAVPFIPLIVTDSMFFPFITGKNFTFRILVEIAFAAWAVLALLDVKYRPRFSWTLVGLSAVTVVMLFANALGELPAKSFWSNYERMDGYVTIVHLFMYFVAFGSTLRTPKAWDWFFNTTLFAASILSLYAFGQLSGAYDINQGGVRVDGTLGNAAYMAVYMLFHIFIAILMAVRARNAYGQGFYGFLAAVFFYLLIRTATRGTLIGLVGGVILAGLYIAIFGKNAQQARRFALAGLVAVFIMIAGFITIKDTDYVQDSPILNRIANISLKEGSTRFEIWGMAFEGVQERPVLGWGQGNFNYVFNKYYQPSLYGQEPWFDRVHNIFMDWLIAGGVLGLLAYLSVFVGSLYHVVVRSVFKSEEHFSVAEQGILLGLLGGYFIHNMFVFDNIVSYIFFGTILAFIHSRVATDIKSVAQYRIPEKIVTNIVAPSTAVALMAVIYYVNVPSIQASGDIIDAFLAPTPEGMLTEFESALARDGFADQEIREQLTQRTQQILRAEGVPEETKKAFAARTEAELMKQVAEKPGDARIHVFVSSYYRSIGQIDKAREQLALARKFSPMKQQIIFEQGFTELQQGNNEAALEFFKTAFELEERYPLARNYYAAALLYSGEKDKAKELITDEYLAEFSKNNIALAAAQTAGAYDLLSTMAEKRVELDPENLQNHVSLASVYYDAGETEKSIAKLEEVIERFPGFKTQAEQYITDIKEGRKPGSQPVNVQVGGETVQATVN